MSLEKIVARLDTKTSRSPHRKRHWLDLSPSATTLIALLSALIASAGVYESRNQREVMDAQLQASEHQMRVQQQPWVGIDGQPILTEEEDYYPDIAGRSNILTSGTLPKKSDSTILSRVKLTNFGSAPALSVYTAAKKFDPLPPVNSASMTTDLSIEEALAFDREYAIERMTTLQDGLCKTAEHQLTAASASSIFSRDPRTEMRERSPLGGATLFQGQSIQNGDVVVGVAKDLTRSTRVLGCVRYRDQYQLPHETRYCFDIAPAVLPSHGFSTRACATHNAAYGIETAEEIQQ